MNRQTKSSRLPPVLVCGILLTSVGFGQEKRPAAADATTANPSPVRAGETAPVGEFLIGLRTVGDAQCARIRQEGITPKGEERPAVREGVESGYHTICECYPAQVEALRSSLPPDELRRRVSQSDFQNKYLSRIVGKCAGEQFRSSFGDSCPERVARNHRNSKEYCRCMSDKLATLSDAELMALGLASADYIPQVANAKAKGLPEPVPPPPMKRFLATDKACGGDLESGLHR
jgi:hypothetical protein